MEVIGEKRAVVMDSFAEHVMLYSRGAPRNPSWVGFARDPNQAMIEEFVASIRENRCPSVPSGAKGFSIGRDPGQQRLACKIVVGWACEKQ